MSVCPADTPSSPPPPPPKYVLAVGGSKPKGPRAQTLEKCPRLEGEALFKNDQQRNLSMFSGET